MEASLVYIVLRQLELCSEAVPHKRVCMGDCKVLEPSLPLNKSDLGR